MDIDGKVAVVTGGASGIGQAVTRRIAAAGVCHSDLSVINGTRPRPLPMVLGHEASGFVEEVGAGVDDLAPGDHVVCIFAPGCGRGDASERQEQHRAAGVRKRM